MVAGVSLFSCSNEEVPAVVENGEIKLEMPLNVSDVVLTDFEGTVTNVQSGVVTKLPAPVKSGDD